MRHDTNFKFSLAIINTFLGLNFCRPERGIFAQVGARPRTRAGVAREGNNVETPINTGVSHRYAWKSQGGITVPPFSKFGKYFKIPFHHTNLHTALTLSALLF
jgi:hypothetical protein